MKHIGSETMADDLAKTLDDAIALERLARIGDPPPGRDTAWLAFASQANRDLPRAFDLLMVRIRDLARTNAPLECSIAELLCTKAVAIEPQNAEAITILAARYIDRGLHAQALQLLTELRSLGTESGLIDRLIGQAAWRAGDRDAAAAAFYRIAARPSDHDWESLKLAAEYFRFEGSRPSLRMLLAQMAEIMDTSGHDDPEIALWYAEWLIEDQDRDGALHWLDRASAGADPNSARYWEVWRLRFGFEHPEDQDKYRELTAGIFSVAPEESAGGLEELCQKHPDFWEARYFLGTCYRRMGRLVDAEACFRRVTTQFDYPNAWLELGGVLGELSRPREALNASLRASGHFGGRNHVALCNAAAACMDLRDFAQAHEHLSAAQKLRPDSDAVKRLGEELERRESAKPWWRRMFGK